MMGGRGWGIPGATDEEVREERGESGEEAWLRWYRGDPI